MILVVNAGSSSLRLAAYRAGEPPVLLAADHLTDFDSPAAGVLTAFVRSHQLAVPDCVVHRVVHGGGRFHQPVLVNSAVEAEIRRLGDLAPLHNPVALEWIQAAREFLPVGSPQVAVFDTAFYAGMPAVASSYALPEALCERHKIRRYGFHGLAHQSMVDAWQAVGGDRHARLLTLQLGSGSSITASRDGRPIDTSMGFSPLEGMMMATRCGDLDPAVVLHLLQHDQFTPRSLLELLNRRSGLLGVSGESARMSDLLSSRSPAAERAVELFCYRARKHLGAFLAVLGGADAVVVGGGIGENSDAVRQRVLAGFEWAGIHLDADANRRLGRNGGFIHKHKSATAILVAQVDEMVIMVRDGMTFANSPQS